MSFAKKEAWINGVSGVKGTGRCMGANLRKYCLLVLTAAFVTLSVFDSRAQADILYLENGRSIEGLIKKEDADNVVLDIGIGYMKFSRDEIKRIEKSSPDRIKLIKEKWRRDEIKEEARKRELEEIREHEPKQVSMDTQSGHITVVTLLNKKVKANLILDTGASFMLLSSEIANKLGMDTKPRAGDIMVEMILADGRKIEGRRIVLESVSVEDSELKRVEAALLPQSESGAVPGDGLLGMSFLKNFSFKIDQKNNTLILEKL